MTAARPRLRRRLAPETRREEIKRAALRVFSRLGFRAATVDDVAAEARTAKGTFYLYFDGKEAAFCELLDDFHRLVQASFAPLHPAAVEVGPIDRAQAELFLAGVYRSFFEVLGDNEPLARLFFQEAVFDEQCRRRREQIYESFATLAQRDLDFAARIGALRPLDTRIVGHAIVGMIERVAELWLLGERRRKPSRTTLDRVAREIALFELHGVLGRTESPERR